MDYSSIGRNIRKARQQKKMRQADLAEKAGLSTNYIGAIERNEKIPSLETFLVIVNALSVSADVVLCDVLENGYLVKHSLISEKLDSLSQHDKDTIYDVINTLAKHARRQV